MMTRFLYCLVVTIIYSLVSNYLLDVHSIDVVASHVDQMDNSVQDMSLRFDNKAVSTAHLLGWCLVGLNWLVTFNWEIRSMLKKLRFLAPALLLVSLSGCWRPFEPVQLETIQANETGFLIPLLGDARKQASTHSEEFLESNLVQTQQVKIPQQWVPVGYEYLWPNGSWKPAAILIKVDRSPVTREWSADPNKGTSTKNEAIWVMTSDQVEFSTGWTCTAYIATREDAVKFLYYYRAGNLEAVMDSEVRARIQTTFGLEVTDLPMEKIRSAATPHIKQVTESVIEFFKTRGVTITNLGISGGFIYTDPSIQKTMVELFNAEQQQAIATATAAALQKTAQGKADAAKTQAGGEAEAIKAVADAKAYEIEKASQDLKTYLELKKLELENKKVEKWKGEWPTTYFGLQGLNDLLNK